MSGVNTDHSCQPKLMDSAMSPMPSSPPFVSAPIFLGLSLHGRRRWVLKLEPIGGAAGTVRGILAAYNSLSVELLMTSSVCGDRDFALLAGLGAIGAIGKPPV
jgi:hypothetical protein